MKKILLLFLCGFTLGLSQTERIKNFHSDIKVEKNGTIRVTETIKVHSNSEIFKRGIVRKLPLYRKDDSNRKIRVDYKLTQVERDFLESSFFTEIQGDFWVIYVGDKDIFLEQGEYEYRLTYTSKGQLGFYKDYDEIYWNVNGFDWNVDFDSLSATIHLPYEVKPISYNCFTGMYGSTDNNCEMNVDGNKINFNSTNFRAGENLTVVTNFTKGFIQRPHFLDRLSDYLTRNGGFAFSLLAFLGLLIYYYITWVKYGKDPIKPTVYPQFDPPENLSPAAIGMIHKNEFSDDLISSSLVNLEIKGCIDIQEKNNSTTDGKYTSQHFIIKKIKDKKKGLSKEEKIIMKELFYGQDEVEVNGEYDENIENMVYKFHNSMNNQYSEMLREGRNRRFLWLPILLWIAMLIIGIVYYNILPNNSKNLIMMTSILGIFVLMIGFAVLTSLNIAIKYSKYIAYAIAGLVFAYVLYDIFVANWNNLSWNKMGFYLYLVTGVLTLKIYRKLIEQPSKEKLRLQSLIEGLEMYIGTAEEKLLQFYNPPEMTPKVFEKLLPYAMTLELEDIWGEKFQKVINKSAIKSKMSAVSKVSSFDNQFKSSLNSSIIASSEEPISLSSSSSGGSYDDNDDWSSGSSSGGGSWSSGSSSSSSSSSSGGYSGGGGGGGGGGGW